MDYNKLNHDLVVALNYSNTPALARPFVVAAAIAVVVSRKLPLAPGDISETQTQTAYSAVRRYVVANHIETINAAISRVNEVTVLPTEVARELTIGLWCIRQSAVSPCAMGAEGLAFGFVDAYVNADKYISPTDSVRLNEHKDAIVAVSAKLSKMLEV